ncbi:hypothetical protein [Lactiplantibacillus pentosus]|uniref:hypothetical protein n=1 Tax=Lactiplantibacillus pentosus TaxID=1589 RepID=UPI001ADDD9FA|nr:hypothetical protein [Lactiplantibacillus pentosus]MBO9165374.1 hypothetical protein [Lactiplantibacillus pentosus]MCT3310163.1 hypothetical protein [Lactiplantibacillus pentosus]USJ85955.1 hypothetical protein KSF55_14630 [Lactiplantibacillus pentosus]
MSKNRTAVTILTLATLVLLSPLLLNQHAILGVDGYFQYNRIYEAAMQIRHGNFSFINLYSFQQAGRVVNSLYSPLITYLAGALLLLLGTWFKFQLVSNFLLYFTSGYLMYRAAQKLHLPKKLSISLGVIFLSSNAVYGFILGTTWRTVALGLLPMFVGPIIDLYKGEWTLTKMLKLGVMVGFFAQFQVLTIVLFLPFLVPFAVHGLWQTKYRVNSLLNLLAGALFAVILSLNALLPILEVYRGNTLISPVAMDLVDNASKILQPLYTGVESSSDIVLTVIVYTMIVGLILFWSQLKPFTKLFSITALVYVIIGTALFPWDLVQKAMPVLQSYLQMPRRISLAGTPFLIVATALVYYEAARDTESQSLKKGVMVTGLVLGVLSLSLCTQKVAHNVHFTTQETTSLADGLHTPKVNVHSKLTRISQLQPAFHTRDLSVLIAQVDRTTPDYVPVTHKIANLPAVYSQVYRQYTQKFSAQRQHFKYKVIHKGIQVSWNAKHAKMRELPVTAYKRTVLTLNGRRINAAQIKHHWVGNISIQQKVGRNVLTISYADSFITKLGDFMAEILWLAIAVLLILAKLPDWQRIRVKATQV